MLWHRTTRTLKTQWPEAAILTSVPTHAPLLAAGHSKRTVTRQLGMTLNTIPRFSRAATPEELFTGQWQSRATKLDPYKPYLDQRRQEGCTNAWKLQEETKEPGCPQSYGNIHNHVSRTLHGRPQPTGPRPPSAPAVTRWNLTHPDTLPESDRLHLKTALANRPQPTARAEHTHSSAHMLTQLQGARLPTWIEPATATTELPSLHRFAQRLEGDLDAVVAVLSLPWNSGVVEGHVNRIKMLKRQMFGRAGFELLRKRVLLTPSFDCRTRPGLYDREVTIEYEWRGDFDNAALNALHADGFGHPVARTDWRERLERHSLGWVCARESGSLVGFVNVVWDGGAHAFILDTVIAQHHQRRGVGRSLVTAAAHEARAAKCEWLHVDFEEHLRPFYFDACGFKKTTGRLIAL